MSLKDFQDLQDRRKPVPQPKYRNKKKVINGIEFDSTKEANRYIDLLNWQASGQIRQLEHQRVFPIEVNGEFICEYIADFTYQTSVGLRVVEDVKSKVTRKHPVYRLKRKLMKAVYGIELEEI